MDSVGQWIRQTRKTKGFSLQQLAEAIGPKVSVQTLINYEIGRELPPRRVLDAAAKALNVSVEVFTYSLVVELYMLDYRNPSNVSARECKEAEAAFQDMLERHFTIEQILELDPPVAWRKKIRPAKLESWEDLEDRAEALRSIWQLGTEPIPSMCELLENNGFKILERDIPKHIHGLACQAQVLNNGIRFVDAVLISRRVNVEQKRFTLALELAHQIIPSTGNPDLPSKKAREWFAGAFLVPKEAVLKAVGSSRGNVTEAEVMALKHEYGVSASCILRRLGQVGILSASTIESAFQSYASSWLESEPEPLQEGERVATLEIPSRFVRLVQEALRKRYISIDRAATLLSKSRAFVEQQLITSRSD